MLDQDKIIHFIRAALAKQPLPVEEKFMFQSLCFMVDDKMCICTKPDHLLCRIGKERVTVEIKKGSGRQMFMKERPMKDFIFVGHESIQTATELNYWIRLCLKFNPTAKSSKNK
jgi:hypothetical protein